MSLVRGVVVADVVMRVVLVLMAFAWVSTLWDVATGALVGMCLCAIPCLRGIAQLFREDVDDEPP